MNFLKIISWTIAVVGVFWLYQWIQVHGALDFLAATFILMSIIGLSLISIWAFREGLYG